jgi:hypothetical protein
MLSAASALCLIRALRTRQGRWLGLLAVLNVLGVYNLYMHLFVVFVEGLVLVLYLRRTPGLFALGALAQVASVASLSVWYRVIAGMDDAILHAGYIPPLSLRRLVEFGREFIVLGPLPAWLMIAWLPLAAALVLFLRRNPYLTARRRPAWEVLVAVGVGMPALFLLISLKRPILELRYLYPMYWAAVVLWAAALMALRLKPWRLLASGLLAVSLIASLGHFFTRPLLADDDWRSAAAYLTRMVQPGSAILVRGGQGYHPLVYYYRGVPVSYEVISPDGGVAHFPAADADGRPYSVLWAVFYQGRRRTDIPAAFIPAPGDAWRLTAEQSFEGVYLIEYERAIR